MYYFAYGSNLLQSRMKNRIRQSRFVEVARLKGYKLVFNFLAGGSGKCDIVETRDPVDEVWGAVYRVPRIRMGALDNFEGVSYNVYKRHFVNVESRSRGYAAVAYVGVDGPRWHRESALPLDWYLHHVVLGAFQLGLPQEYQRFLRNQDCIRDTNIIRFTIEAELWR